MNLLLKKIYTVGGIFRSMGIRAGTLFVVARVLRLLKCETSWRVKLRPSKDIEVWVRICEPDIAVYGEAFCQDEFKVDCQSPQVIIDAGAYIGLSTVYYATKYPRALILAIEPNQENFEILVKNTSRYRNVKPINAALWHKETQLNLIDGGTGAWGYMATEMDLGETLGQVQGVTIKWLMEEYCFNYIDILKIDIEGGELEVFASSQAWIDRVGVVLVELHERKKPGCTMIVRSALGNSIEIYQQGEKLVCRLRSSKSGLKNSA